MAGCQGKNEAVAPLLTGRAILPADTFSDGPAVGHQLIAHGDSLINGRRLPFDRVPVQGFSSLILNPDGSYLALQDNGFGTLANSPRYPLRWYELEVDLAGSGSQEGSVKVRHIVTLSDPHSHLTFPLAQPSPERILHGADFDPESFVRLDDGTFWVGEEFGPFLLHFNAQGQLLSAPVAVPVTPPLRAHGRGSYFFRSPDHPDLRFLKPDHGGKTADELANIAHSGGIEAMTRNHDGSLIYVAVEKALRDDLDPTRRSILEFDPTKGRFTGNFWFIQTEDPAHYITSLDAFTDQVFLVLERDKHQGSEARYKRIFRIDLDEKDNNQPATQTLPKTLVCDLMNLRDNLGLSIAEDGAIGLGPHYSFPYVTPESLIILDAQTILVCNDNNYPMSSGRRPAGTPDDNEFIRIKLNKPLQP